MTDRKKTGVRQRTGLIYEALYESCVCDKHPVLSCLWVLGAISGLLSRGPGVKGITRLKTIHCGASEKHRHLLAVCVIYLSAIALPCIQSLRLHTKSKGTSRSYEPPIEVRSCLARFFKVRELHSRDWHRKPSNLVEQPIGDRFLTRAPNTFEPRRDKTRRPSQGCADLLVAGAHASLACGRNPDPPPPGVSITSSSPAATFTVQRPGRSSASCP
jgi:hypothetical protein